MPEVKNEQDSPSKSHKEKSDFTEFAKVVYHRLKIYRGIYIFYSIVTFMLGLPVMVTGFKKQFFTDDKPQKILHCPHYLGIISILSCCVSLWTALKNQIVICVLTLLTGIITVISAMIVLVTSALDLGATPFVETPKSEHDEQLSQQTHVVFIFSIGLLIASLAIVITSLSHLSARRVKRPKIEIPECLPKQESADELKEIDDKEPNLNKCNNHRYSFATTISSLIKHELKDNISYESRERLKKTLSCPSDSHKKNNSDLALDVIVHSGPRVSTHSLPECTENYNDDVLDRWRRASFLTQHQNHTAKKV